MSDLTRILLIGSDGQVGWELRRTLAPVGQVISASVSGEGGPAIDLVSAASVRKVFDDTRPDAIVNAAAYTAVDRAETDRELAKAINADALALTRRACGGRRDPGRALLHRLCLFRQDRAPLSRG